MRSVEDTILTILLESGSKTFAELYNEMDCPHTRILTKHLCRLVEKELITRILIRKQGAMRVYNYSINDEGKKYLKRETKTIYIDEEEP